MDIIKLKKIKEFKSKTYYELDKEPGRISYSPDIFLLPRFGKESYLKEIDREAFMQLVINSNFLVWELENYEHFTRLLSLIYQPFSLSELRLNSLKSLVNLSQCYILGIKRGEIIKDTVNRIKVLFKTK